MEKTTAKKETKTTKKVSATKKPTTKKTTVKKADLKKKNTKTKNKKVESKKVTLPYKNIKILGYNNLELNTFVYDNVENPKAVVVIVHGMMEHCLRYKNFALFLNKHGYIVVTNDLRGHGKTAVNKEMYGRGEKDIFTESLQDELNVISYAKETFNLPIYLLGHSYGSFLSQNLIQLTQNIEKCVLSGTSNGSCTIMKLGGKLASIMAPFKKSDKRGGLIEKMCIKSYEKGFKDGNWLSRDEKVFEEYNKDEFCGGSFPFSFYRSLITNMNKTNKGIEKIGNKKILFIVGDKDPLSQGSKQVQKLYKLFLKKNINAQLKIYPGARHELLNEINKTEVYQDVLNFFEA